jgi:hypothetical protein
VVVPPVTPPTVAPTLPVVVPPVSPPVLASTPTLTWACAGPFAIASVASTPVRIVIPRMFISILRISPSEQIARRLGREFTAVSTVPDK